MLKEERMMEEFIGTGKCYYETMSNRNYLIKVTTKEDDEEWESKISKFTFITSWPIGIELEEDDEKSFIPYNAIDHVEFYTTEETDNCESEFTCFINMEQTYYAQMAVNGYQIEVRSKKGWKSGVCDFSSIGSWPTGLELRRDDKRFFVPFNEVDRVKLVKNKKDDGRNNNAD